jgi:hypothetical protein
MACRVPVDEEKVAGSNRSYAGAAEGIVSVHEMP